jgi:hypothetical protein
LRHARILCSAALLAAVALSGCRNDSATAQTGAFGGPASHRPTDLNLPSGTLVDVTLTTALTSENARVGDAWTGSVRNAKLRDGREVLPAGSLVAGTITAVTPARKGDRAMLDLEWTSATVGDQHYRVRGSMRSVVAGAGAAAVSRTRGSQVVLKEGTVLTFTTNEALAARP